MSRRHALAGVLAAAAMLLAACGDQKQDSAIDGDPATTIPSELANLKPAPPRDPNTPLPEAKSIQGVSGDLKVKPAIKKPDADTPDELQGKDVVVGKGAVAKSGDAVTVRYVGWLFSTGKEFDTSWQSKTDPGDGFPFTIGQGAVIEGWDNGVPGMKVGGRRILVIPADEAYGSEGSPPNIGADETLVFVIDLVKIDSAAK